MIDFAAARRAMVDCQIRPSDVTNYALIDAMLWVPRELFVPRSRRSVAYAETDIPLEQGRVLLAPRTLAKMIESVGVGPGDLVLDLASGMGYSAAVLARMAEAVVAIESDAAMVQTGQGLLGQLEIDNAVLAEGSPAQGDAAHGPYDVIFINGAVKKLPETLGDQLRDGGRLVAIFNEGPLGQCRVLTKTGQSLSERKMFDAMAPLLQEFGAEEEFTF